MDKLKSYKEIIKKELSTQASIPFANASNLQHHLIINKEETQFILLKLGWMNDIFKHGLIYHFQIKDNKVWLYKNNTDIDIGARLVKQGIPKSDIVLGFVSEYERGIEGYAQA